ncbi:MAG TPA: holin [Micromonosporaceae bacterium]|nr:holin [Micromonosporaceae bacterium]
MAWSTRCATHTHQARGRQAAHPQQQAYRTPGHAAFRVAVLDRDPHCQCHDLYCPRHQDRPCEQPSAVADHWPLTRRQLVAQGFHPDDPARGRGLCLDCHNRATQLNPITRGGGFQ